MSRTWPLSIYFSLSAGSTVLWKLAQCGHVIEAYSTMVTGASALPIDRSGRAPGFRSSSGLILAAVRRRTPLEAVSVRDPREVMRLTMRAAVATPAAPSMTRRDTSGSRSVELSVLVTAQAPQFETARSHAPGGVRLIA